MSGIAETSPGVPETSPTKWERSRREASRVRVIGPVDRRRMLRTDPITLTLDASHLDLFRAARIAQRGRG